MRVDRRRGRGVDRERKWGWTEGGVREWTEKENAGGRKAGWGSGQSVFNSSAEEGGQERGERESGWGEEGQKERENTPTATIYCGPGASLYYL